jgi:hypothetical protein
MFSLDRKIGTQADNNEDKLSGIYEIAGDYAYELLNETTYDEWKAEYFDPPLQESEDTTDPVVRIYFLAPDDNNNWYEIEAAIDADGNLAKVSKTPESDPGWNPCSTPNEISRTSYCSRCYCCWIQYRICSLMKSVFWWRNVNCDYSYYFCQYLNCYLPCDYYFGKWGMYWLLCYWYGFCC